MSRSPSRFVRASCRLAAPLVCAAVLVEHPRALVQRGVAPRGMTVTLEGGEKKWHFLTMTFATSVHTDESAHPIGENPFLDYRMTVTFLHLATGTTRSVPGFYAADGRAADSGATAGNRWRVHFTPDLAGAWRWFAEFRRGPGIAVDPGQQGTAADSAIDGSSGLLGVAPADPSAPGFLSKGMLRYAGGHYFRFAEPQEDFLKNGAGGPENFLAYFEFDGTSGDIDSLCLTSPENPEHLHRFAPHAADYTGDAVDQLHTWGPEAKGANILGAINYLARVGVNSLYFLTNTHLGDGNDVWPWTAPTDKTHFDVSKLDQWERVFSHMSHRGIQLQAVLEEGENDQIPTASGGLGYGLTLERKLYYRELVARFAHHHAVIWVIGDESSYYDEIETMEALATHIRTLDPYEHPIAFHGKHPCFGPSCSEVVPSVFQQYSPYFGFQGFEASAFQTVPGQFNNSTIQLRSGQSLSRKWAHYGDEQSLNATPANLNENRRKALWGNLMGGGAGVAWYPGNANPAQYLGLDMCDYFDLSLEDLALFEDYFLQTSHAIDIFESQLPFTEMVPDNALASVRGPQDYVFYRPEDGQAGRKAVYAVYRATGTTTDLTLGPGTHTAEWFNPRTGEGPLPGAPLSGPGPVTLLPPSQDPGSDGLAVVRQQ